jgi:hypothetical protein
MSEQINFAIRPNGGSLEIEIQGDGIAQPYPIFSRELPNLAAPQLDIFRTGDSKGKDLDALQKAVTDWLLGPDLKPLVNQWIGLNFPPRMRLVFKLDSRVQLSLDDLPFELMRIDAAADPVVIHPRVENFVYALPPSAAAPSAALNRPMRIQSRRPRRRRSTRRANPRQHPSTREGKIRPQDGGGGSPQL